MKEAKFFLMMMVIGFVSHSQSVITDPISITDGDDSYGYRSPKIIKYGNNNDQVLVFWSNTSNDPGFYISKLTDGDFTTPIPVPLSGLTPNIWSGNLGPGIASSGDHIYITFEVYGDAIYCVHSADAGESWEEPVQAFIPPEGRYATIPNIATNNNGFIFIAYVNTNSMEEDAHYGLVRSADFGVSFTEEVIVNDLVPGDEVCECCNGNIEIAPNDDVYVGFRNNNLALRDCWITKSTNSGNSFTEVYDVDETDWILNGCPNNGPDFALTDNELVTVFFTGADDWDNGVYFSSLNPVSGDVSTASSISLTNAEATSQTAARIATGDELVGVVFQELNELNYDIGFSFGVTSQTLGSGSYVINDADGNQTQPAVLNMEEVFHIVYADDPSGTVMYQQFLVDPISVSENSSHFEMTIHPTLVESEIKLIKLPDGPAHFSITTQTGAEVRKGVVETNFIEVSSLSSGIYFLRIGGQAFRFVKI